jgi:hypothetical protein
MQGPTWDPLPATFSQKKKNRTNKRKKIAAPVREAASCARKRGSARVRNWFCAALVRCRRWLFPPFFPIRRRRLLIPFQAVAEAASYLSRMSPPPPPPFPARRCCRPPSLPPPPVAGLPLPRSNPCRIVPVDAVVDVTVPSAFTPFPQTWRMHCFKGDGLLLKQKGKLNSLIHNLLFFQSLVQNWGEKYPTSQNHVLVHYYLELK